MELFAFLDSLRTIAFAWFAVAFVAAATMFFVTPKTEKDVEVKNVKAEVRERRAA